MWSRWEQVAVCVFFTMAGCARRVRCAPHGKNTARPIDISRWMRCEVFTVRCFRECTFAGTCCGGTRRFGLTVETLHNFCGCALSRLNRAVNGADVSHAGRFTCEEQLVLDRLRQRL